MTDRLGRTIPERIDAVLNAQTDNFIELCELVGLDPKADFQKVVIRGADFRGCDLSAFDFSNSTFIGGTFQGAAYGSGIFSGVRFKDVDLTQANDWTERQQRAPIAYTRWIRSYLDADDAERSPNVLGKILSIDDKLIVVDVGNGFCRRINKSLLKETLESYSDSGLGDTIIIPERVVEGVPAIYFGADDSDAMPMSWAEIKNAFEADETVFGMIFRSVKGGFLVRLGLEVAFLPGSQVDTAWPPDVSDMLNVPQPFEILSVGTDGDRDVIVSRLAVLKRAEVAMQDEIIAKFRIGTKVLCTVNRIVEQGVAVTVDGVRALIHQSTIPPERWVRAETEFHEGQKLEAAIIQMDKEKRYVRLSLNEAAPDAWTRFATDHKANDVVTGIVKNCTESAVFVDLGGFAGMVHLGHVPAENRSDLAKAYPTGAQVAAVIRAIDRRSGRVDLSFSDVDANPWPAFLERYQKGDIVEGIVINANNHGLFVEIQGVVGLVSELLPEEFSRNPGDRVTLKIFAIYPERSRLRLSFVPQDTAITDITTPVKSAKEIFNSAAIGDMYVLAISKVGKTHFELSLARQIMGLIPRRAFEWKGNKLWRVNAANLLGREIAVAVIDKDEADETLIFGTSGISRLPFDDFYQLFKVGEKIDGIVAFSNDGRPIVDLLDRLFASIIEPDLVEWAKMQGQWQNFMIVEINEAEKSILLQHLPQTLVSEQQ